MRDGLRVGPYGRRGGHQLEPASDASMKGGVAREIDGLEVAGPEVPKLAKGLYEIDGVIHYCVANMPGAVARTSAFALNNATLPFALKLASQGAEAAMKADPHLAAGLNVSNGKIRHQAVAEALGLPFDSA